MNLIGTKGVKVTDHRKLLKDARRLFRKNRLHESIALLTKLKHHGFNTDKVNLLLARVYDRLAFLTSEAEYEDAAMERYEELIRYTGSWLYKRRGIKLRNKLSRRISSLNENDMKARTKAEEMDSSVPSSPKAWFILGANFPVRKDPMFVINAYKNAVKLNHNYILALFRIAYLYHYYVQDIEKAKSYYLRAVKIPPFEDPVEPEALNVKTILESCNELSDIFYHRGNMKKVISVFDHAMNIYRSYTDICSPHDIKRILKNSYNASISLDNVSALKKHSMNRYGIDLDLILADLGVI